MQEPENSSPLNHTLNTRVRTNAVRNDTKTYSTTMNALNRSSPKCFRRSCTLFNNSVIAIVLTIGLFLSLIQESAASPSTLAPSDVTTTYSSVWTVNSPMFSRRKDQIEKHYYYELIPMSVSMMGTYTFTSRSPINTYGYLYEDEFKPADLSLKLISQDDDTGGQGQFRITAVLQPGHKYILIATTYSPETTGEFSIMSSGPATVDIPSKPLLRAGSSTVAVSTSTTGLSSTYSGILSSSSPIFVRPGGSTGYYYYQAIRVIISTTGTYTFTSSSSIDTYGYFYNDPIDPSSPSQNLITSDDDGSNNGQFRISVTLQSGRTYVLLVTTHSATVIGGFSIRAFGPASIGLTSFTPATSRPITSTNRPTTTTNRPTTTTNRPTTTTNRATTSTSRPTTSTSRPTTSTSRPTTSTNRPTTSTSGPTTSTSRPTTSTSRPTTSTNRPATSTSGPTTSTSRPTISTSRPITSTMATTALVPSSYSGTLSSSSPVFFRPNGNTGYYYYQVIRVTVYTTGAYTFTSISSVDTYGYFYYDPVDPSYPSQNLITSDDDGGNNRQFRINVTLQSGRTYVLLVTTYSTVNIGSFFITAMGPASVGLTSFTPSTSRPISTTTTTTALVPSSYSGTLLSSSPVFVRPDSTGYYCYQAIRVTVYMTGTYTFTSSSSMDTYGYFYYDPVDPSYPSQNLITSDDDGGNNRQFRINVSLQFGYTYVLLVTTYSTTDTGSFSIRAVGPASVGLTSFTPSTSRPIRTTTTTPDDYVASISGTLSSYSSPEFVRPGSSGYYYYQAIRVTVYMTGRYTFTSISSMDTYGYFYYDPVDPSYPSQNLITSDDDGDGNRQFRINVNLQSGRTYVLIVTTLSSTTTGSFSIRAYGPTSIGLSPFTPTTSRPIRTPFSYSPTNTAGRVLTIMGITFGCIILLVSIIGICVHRHNRNTTSAQRIISWTHNQNVRVQSHPMTNLNMNAPRPTGTQPPYTILRSTGNATHVEEPPPSYDAVLPSLTAQTQAKSNQ